MFLLYNILNMSIIFLSLEILNYIIIINLYKSYNTQKEFKNKKNKIINSMLCILLCYVCIYTTLVFYIFSCAYVMNGMIDGMMAVYGDLMFVMQDISMVSSTPTSF